MYDQPPVYFSSRNHSSKFTLAMNSRNCCLVGKNKTNKQTNKQTDKRTASGLLPNVTNKMVVQIMYLHFLGIVLTFIWIILEKLFLTKAMLSFVSFWLEARLSC